MYQHQAHCTICVCVSVCPLLTESYLIQVNPGSFTISDFLIAHCRGTVGSNFLAEWWATSCRFHALSKLFSGSELIVYIVHFRFQHFQAFWNALFAGRNITLVEKRASYGLAVGWFCASPFNIRHVKSSLTPDLTTHKRELCRDHRSLGLLLRGEKICDMDTTNMTHDVYVVFFFLETRCYGLPESPKINKKIVSEW